ncbi:2-dehydropantoate 2-reductase [Zavarzinia sp.]|uniref:2-dehydropantoate 2-reductase n=1 Tax=Zavarzinia sp. TaxID=2027920 RepID=UPI00356784AF
MNEESAGRIAVLGAGLIGCYIGGRLAAAGGDVTLIGRERVLGPLRAEGLTVSDLDGAKHHLPPEALTLATDPSALARADLIIVAVKSPATASAAADIAAHARSAVPVLSFQNGVTNPERLRAALPGHPVLAGMVPYNVAEPAPGHFHQGTSGKLMVDDAPAIRPWLALFQAAGLPLSLRSDMAAVLWAKLLINLNNAINALAGVPLAEQLAARDYRRCFALCQSEALRLLARAGIEPAQLGPLPPKRMPFLLSLPNFLFRSLSKRGGTPKIDRHARSSMAEDLAAGRKTEVDYINGAIVDLAASLGAKAPVNARVIELIRAAEDGAAPWPAKALWKELRNAAKAARATPS